MDVWVALRPPDGSVSIVTARFSGIKETWTRHEATLKMAPASIHPSGRLCIIFGGPGTIAVDLVSMIPEANALMDGPEPWPFREDLLQRLRDLTPK